MLIAALFIVFNVWKEARCCQQRNGQGCGTCVQWDTTQPSNKNEVLPFAATWMDLQGIMLNKIIQGKTNIVYH